MRCGLLDLVTMRPVLCLTLLLLPLSCLALTPSAYFSVAERDRLRGALTAALSGAGDQDLAAVHGAALGIKLLVKAVPKDTAALCKRLQDSLATGADLQTLFLAAEAGEALGCKLKAASEVSQVRSNVSVGKALHHLFSLFRPYRRLPRPPTLP